MIAQYLDIPGYDWRIDIMYDVRSCDADMILDRLYGMGCPRRYLYRAGDLLRGGKPNQGLTYSDKANRHSVIVVCEADSIGQYVNTLVHEVDHLADHISQYYGIPYDSEENSYLYGDVAEAIYNDAIRYAVRKYVRHLRLS